MGEGDKLITIIQGALGSGKSAVGLVRGLRHLQFGGLFVCNYNLVDGWHYKLADMDLRVRLGFRDRDKLAHSYHDRCFKAGKASGLYELAEKIPELVTGYMKTQREGHALLVIDEAQLYFNSRDWQKNKDFIQFFSQSRKLKYDIVLIAHDIEMIDKQIRAFLAYEERFRNMKDLKMPLLPFRFPVNGFLEVQYYAGRGAGKGARHSWKVNFFDKKMYQLYDTFELFAFDELQEGYVKQGRKHWKPQKKRKKYNFNHTKCHIINRSTAKLCR